MLIDESLSCHLCCRSHTNSQGVGAGINMQPAYLSSAAHLEPVFMYKGEVCTGKFVFIQAKGYMYVKVGAVNNCWEDQQGYS